MTEFKLSDFKMFKKAPYDMPDPRAFTQIAMNGAKEVEKTYGPVFITRFIKNALWFIAQKTGEKPPEDIKTLDQLKEYLISTSNKYPTPYCAATYAQVKTETMFQGYTGAGTRVELIGISRNALEGLDSKGGDLDADDLLSKGVQLGFSIKAIPSEIGYNKNEDGSLDILLPKCPFMDGCKLAFNEGLLKRPNGRTRCCFAEGLCLYFKMSSGHEWDYNVLEFDKPHCIYRCYIL